MSLPDSSWQKVILSGIDSPESTVVYQKKNVPYRNPANALQTLDICIPAGKFSNAPQPVSGKDIWVIYIHGGAWRDPLVAAESFELTQHMLLTGSNYKDVINHVAGFASINYTLSPYPSHGTCPSDPKDPSRNAKHPEHILDVRAAVRFLQTNLKFYYYMLVGHSCGATLAFQEVMLELPIEDPAKISPRHGGVVAVLGVAGLYDLIALTQPSGSEHDKYLDLYRAFIENAFGKDLHTWAVASPTMYEYSREWPEQVLSILAHSWDDSLVPPKQFELMQQCLEPIRDRVHCLNLEGDHNEMWEKGLQLARAIQFAHSMLQEAGHFVESP